MLELKHISYAVREGDSELGILNDISLTIDDHRLVVFTLSLIHISEPTRRS